MDSFVLAENSRIIGSYVLVGILLVCEGMRDFCKKEISVPVCLGFGVAGLLLHIPDMRQMWISVLGGILLGLLVLGVAYISRGNIGCGDGVILMATGALLGGYRNLMLFMYALFLCCFVCVGLLLFRRVGRKSGIAFVPFMLPAYLIIIITEEVRIL